MPKESVIQLHTGDFSLPLELVPGVTLEGDGVPRFSAVPVAGTILRHTRLYVDAMDARTKGQHHITD